MTELEEISYDIASYVTNKHDKDDIRSLREFIEERLKESVVSDEQIKRYRKEGRLSGAIKREPFYKLIAQKFDENYEDTDFDILYDC